MAVLTLGDFLIHKQGHIHFFNLIPVLIFFHWQFKVIPSDYHPAMPPLLWTLDQSRFSFPRGFYSVLLSDDTFNDFIASATGEFLSINNNNSVYGNLSKLIYVCRSFLFQFTRTEPKIQAAKRDGKAGREKETWGKTSTKGPWVRLQTTLLPSSQAAWGHWTGKHTESKNAASLQNKVSCFYILVTTRCILTPLEVT